MCSNWNLKLLVRYLDEGMSRTRCLIAGVLLGACDLTGGGAAGNFLVTASVSHSSMVLPDLA